MWKRTRSEKGKSAQTPSHSPLFVSSQAQYRYIVLSTKNISSGRCVVVKDFEHLNLAHILRANSLKNFLSIRESAYPSLVPYFYTNLSFESIRLGLEFWGKT